VVFNLNNT